jgi:hypothetical protein
MNTPDRVILTLQYGQYQRIVERINVPVMQLSHKITTY